MEKLTLDLCDQCELKVITMKTHNTMVMGCGIAMGLEFPDCTCTHGNHDPIIAGLPIPLLFPSLSCLCVSRDTHYISLPATLPYPMTGKPRDVQFPS